MFPKAPAPYTLAADMADAKGARERAELRARLAVFDAFPRPMAPFRPEEVEALRTTPVRFVVDLLYVAHAARILLEEAFDGTPSNDILALRQFALAQPQSMNPSDISRQLGVKRQTASALLARMKSDGLLIETGDPIDSRTKKMWLNEGTEEAILDAREALEHVGKQLLRNVPTDARDGLATALRALRDRTFARPFPPPPRSPRKRRTLRVVEEAPVDLAGEEDSEGDVALPALE